MSRDATEGAEQEGRQPVDRRRQMALRLEIRNRPARRRIRRVPGLSDDLPAVRWVSGECLGTLVVRPAEDHAADAVRPGRLRQRRHERSQQRQPAERQPDDQHTTPGHPPPTARVTWPPASKRSSSRDRQRENLPQNKLPTQSLDHERGNRQHQRSHRDQLQQGLATPSREPPPQTSRKRDDDHDRADVGAHLNPPSSQMQWIQTRRRTTRPTGGPHAAEVWPPTHATGCSSAAPRLRSDALEFAIQRARCE